MAVALKCKYFKAAKEVTAFTTLAGNNVTTIISLIYDTTTAQFVLFWI